ncbi:EboA domain-containing protein [Mycetohabitans endofungorum]|uniref:EboA domain-containing protein n=1 Tax=Mycetohabitans endofungorum TaxID=417203 RepID=UPI0030D4F3A3
MTIANTLYAGLLQATEACSAEDKADRAKNWLARCQQIITRPASCSDDLQHSVEHHFAIAQRRLAGLPSLPDKTLDTLRGAGVIAPQQWSIGDFGRALILLHALSLRPSAEYLRFVTRLYRRGDNTEQQAILRSLILLPEPQRWVSIAAEGCRSNVAIVFEAIACDNAYPERFLCELNFNQLVLKALFTGTSIRRIAGLNKRLSPTLKRMVADYASERRAAKRQISDDLNFLLRGIEHENV